MDRIICKCDICNLFNSFKFTTKENQSHDEQAKTNGQFLLERFMEIVVQHDEFQNAKTVIRGIEG